MTLVETSVVYPAVVWQGEFKIGPFVIIGHPAKHHTDDLPTHIASGAVIQSHTVIYAGNRIGTNFFAGHGVLIREENEIGNHVSIGSGSNVEHHVRIGDRVRLHSNVFVPEFSVLEDECWLGPNVILTNAKYPASPGAKRALKGPHIEKGAKIGANATILPGVRIGRNALVGAGAVVTKDVAPGSVVAGNPAKMINDVSRLPYKEDR